MRLIALIVLFPITAFSQDGIQVSDFKVFDWFKAVKLTWVVTAPDGSDGVFEIYRSDKEEGPYALVKEIELGDKEYVDVITKSYVFLDKDLRVGGRYWYKLSLRGNDQEFGPLEGLASGAPPGT